MKLREIATKLDCNLVGDGEIEITGVNSLESAGSSDLSFLSNPKYTPQLKTTKAAAVLVGLSFEPKDKTVLRCRDPYVAFAKALELFYRPPSPVQGVHATAVVAPSALIGPNASIGPYVVVSDNVEIGRNAVLHAHVVIYPGVKIGDDFCAHTHSVVREHCRIGNRVLLQNHVVVGADGFGFAKQSDGSQYKIVQSGIVVIEDDVEIQANSCVDRATMGETRIKQGTKIDNMVQVGHASVIGEHSILCAQVGVGGSSTLGKNVLLAGQVGLAGHMKVGDNVIVTAQSGIHGVIPPNTMISGTPGIENRLWLRCIAAFSKLPEMVKSLRELKAEVAALQESKEK